MNQSHFVSGDGQIGDRWRRPVYRHGNLVFRYEGVSFRQVCRWAWPLRIYRDDEHTLPLPYDTSDQVALYKYFLYHTSVA